MRVLHQTESGYVAVNAGKKIELRFQNFCIRLTSRSLRKLNAYLATLNPNSNLFNPSEKAYQVHFSSFPMSLYFDYYEIHEFMELVSEGIAQWELYQLLDDAGVSFSTGAEV